MEKFLLISIVLSLLLIIGVYIYVKYFTEEEDKPNRGTFLKFSLTVCIPFINIFALFYLISTSKTVEKWLDKPL
jgi:hypothetical protein